MHIEHLFRIFKHRAVEDLATPHERLKSHVVVSVFGVGGGGGNAVRRMAREPVIGVEYYALNTDVQALRKMNNVRTLAIGPDTTNGMGSGGLPEIGRKAFKESQDQVSALLEGSDMVFVTAGMGGGTGTGAAAAIADLAKKQGALTGGIVTLPFGFEGPRRRELAEQGMRNLGQKVDTLIAVENDRLLPSLDAETSLDTAFRAADEVLRQGVQGVADIIMSPGVINVDFADVKSVMKSGGLAFMAVGEGKGTNAAFDAVDSALSNPLFDTPINGAKGVLFNVVGGADLSLSQVHRVADVIREAAGSDARVIFGIVQDGRMKKRVKITLVATNVAGCASSPTAVQGDRDVETDPIEQEITRLLKHTNGTSHIEVGATHRMF